MGIEEASVLGEKIGIENIASSVIVAVLVVEAGGCEPINLARDIAWMSEQIPKLGWRRGFAGNTAAAANDGNRFVTHFDGILLVLDVS